MTSWYMLALFGEFSVMIGKERDIPTAANGEKPVLFSMLPRGHKQLEIDRFFVKNKKKSVR